MKTTLFIVSELIFLSFRPSSFDDHDRRNGYKNGDEDVVVTTALNAFNTIFCIFKTVS